MARQKLSTRLLVGFAGVVLISIGLVSVSLGIVLRRDYVARAAQRFGEDVEQHAEEFRRAAEQGDRPELDRLCEALNDDFDGRVSLIGRDGTILADSISARCAARARPDCLPMIRKQQDLRLQSYMPLNETVTVRWPVRLGRLGPATARLALPIGPVRRQLQRLYALLLGTGIAASLLAVWLGVRLSRRIARPIEAMTAGAERIAAGDFEQPVHAEGQDEIGRLGEALETMRQSLRSNLAAITKERNQAMAIVKGMSDGVVCLSDTGQVIFANQAAASLLNLVEIPPTQTPFEALSVPHDLSACVHRTVETGAETATEFGDIKAGERVVRVTIAPVDDPSLGAERGAVLVLRDMTEARRAEAMGKELVANASHELRTPLAIISSTADTILAASESDPEAVKEFAGIIARHAVRMERLVQETLQLTRLEGGNPDWEWEELSPGELVQQAVDLLQPAAREAGKTIRIDVPQDMPAVRGVESLLLQALQNLLDNAIRYSSSATRIICCVKAHNNAIDITVADEGPAIPPADQKRIFERFVRGGTGSRTADGTGLGLAIVQRVAEVHKGSIFLDSRPGEGNCFTLRLPRKGLELPRRN